MSLPSFVGTVPPLDKVSTFEVNGGPWLVSNQVLLQTLAGGGYLNVLKKAEMMDFQTFVGPLVETHSNHLEYHWYAKNCKKSPKIIAGTQLL